MDHVQTVPGKRIIKYPEQKMVYNICYRLRNIEHLVFGLPICSGPKNIVYVQTADQP